MIQIRQARDRGHANHGWLDTWHTFSFADYFDPDHMGFRHLRVINEDRIEPGQGFGAHPHNDMEILTYVLEGALEHRDSMGNGSIIRPGDVQRMSAGTGVIHSEFNASKTDPAHLLQIWMLPADRGLKPGYEQKTFDAQQKRARLCLVASRDAREGSVKIHQDIDLYASALEAGQGVRHGFAGGRHGWLQVTRGRVTANGAELLAGDGAAVSEEKFLSLAAEKKAEFLLFDLA